MSKAFVRESESEDDDDDLDASVGGGPAGATNYITPKGYQALQTELQQLLKVERPKTVEIVSWAASNGDRSENGDYIYGKRRLREIDRRLRFLNKRLGAAQVVDPSVHVGSSQVFFGAAVTILDESGQEQTYRIVGVDETALYPNAISWVAPLSRALIKAHEGDSIAFQSPSGPRQVDIVKVDYIVE